MDASAPPNVDRRITAEEAWHLLQVGETTFYTTIIRKGLLTRYPYGPRKVRYSYAEVLSLAQKGWH
jgi:predicted DNA-binding transcriptional regulator AlpA